MSAVTPSRLAFGIACYNPLLGGTTGAEWAIIVG
jgi:hypothetical protein